MDSITDIKISVRELVEFVLRSGDLISSFSGSTRNTDAIRAHQKIQKSAPSEYESEVTISHRVVKGELSIQINGRIDGVITLKDEVIIDEIKTTTNNLDNINENYNLVHWAQAKCYAYFYGVQNNLPEIKVRLTYYQMDTGELKHFVKAYSLEELEVFFNTIINRYIHYGTLQKNWLKTRTESINKLEFPYKSYRMGQRELAVAIYNSIKQKSLIFAKAPTGIGKTMASIFPAIKAMGLNLTSKIFYLTAKNTTGIEALKAMKLMNAKGLSIKTVWITAKEKICFQEEVQCDPEKCSYAKGHFDRVNEALEDIFFENMLTKEVIEAYSKKHRVCPFEFSLDLTNWSDCIVCDYNYVFDPRVYLRRFFMEEKGDYTLLVDEAHNLVDRAREMYSSQISKKEILNLKNISKNISSKIYRTLNKINTNMITERKKCEEADNGFIVQEEAPKELISLVRKYVSAAEGFILDNPDCDIKEELLDLYFKANSFIRTYEGYDAKYVTYNERLKDDFIIKMFCIDPSEHLKECLKKVSSAVFFSATLSPMNYFIELLGGDMESFRLNIPSPFKSENLCVLINDNISTKYKNRADTYDRVVNAITSCISEKQGNYLVFFPSYKYMEAVYELFKEENPSVKAICQKSNMSTEERENFIEQYSEYNKETLTGFVVLGGVFSEGLDLPQEKLIGSIIVGVGLPMVCTERIIINDYFSRVKGCGFQYAYIYPGINKVLQAAGRVIRTEEDRGVVLLIDERYREQQYINLLPHEWSTKRIFKGEFYSEQNLLKDFWET